MEITVACVQPVRNRDDFNASCSAILNILDVNKELKRDVILLPEYWNGISQPGLIESHSKASLEFLMQIAADYKSFVIGSIMVAETGKLYNRCYIINQAGNICAFYDKRHPFGHEKAKSITPGERYVYFDIKGIKASCVICSDLWHTDEFAQLIDNHVSILFVPALTVVPDFEFVKYARTSWYNLAATRAKEGCMAIVVSDFACGVLQDSFYVSGASSIVDPSVRFTNEQGPFTSFITMIRDNGPGMITKTLSISKILEYREYRKNMGLL